MDKQIRYLADETGKNQDNLVKNEPHYLPPAVRGRVIVPDQGSFYGKSVIVRDKLSKRELTPVRDFVCALLRPKHTKIANEGIYALILVTDDDCSTDVEITYRTYGNDMFQFVEPTIQLLQESFESNEGIPMAKLLNLPKKWDPTFHYMDLGNIDKFDFMLFCLERIRNSILLDNHAVFKYLVDFEDMLYLLMERSSTQLEMDMFAKMRSYAKAFGKQMFGLEKVNNYPLMVDGDGKSIANQEMHPQVMEGKESYLNMGILTEFTKQLFQIYVDLTATNIGGASEMAINASTDDFEAQLIGTIFTINDYNFAAIANNPEIDKYYPDRLDRANGYVVRKITGANSGVGSLYLYTGRSNGRTYILRVILGTSGPQTTFRYVANSNDQPEFLSTIQEHLEDYFNPHMDDKRDVDLAQVENLPPATKEDITCNMPVRKYLTVDNILMYMKRFKTGVKDTSDIYANLSEASVRKQMQTIYSPCGAWEDNLDVDKIELCRVIEVPTIAPPIDPVWSVTPDVTSVTIELVESDVS